MFGVLVESNPRPRRRRGGVALSAAVHAAVVLLAVWATTEGAEREDPLGVQPDDRLTPTYLPPRQREPETRSAPAFPAGPAPAPVPRTPVVPAVGGLDIPNTIPPVDVPLGDPLRDAIVPRVIGDRAGPPRAPDPANVFDNRIAEKPALPLEGNVPPRYPEMLRTARVEGLVDVEFVIDARGRLRPGSIVVRRADHPEFLGAVRVALAAYRYLPAEVGGVPVAVRVRQRFVFALER
ncbi:MAG TPA: TonB family protein [Gemmatimonadaceae bacterium]|nr:TonB family protein [Gemmatimonadaceae bacterium]